MHCLFKYIYIYIYIGTHKNLISKQFVDDSRFRVLFVTHRCWIRVPESWTRKSELCHVNVWVMATRHSRRRSDLKYLDLQIYTVFLCDLLKFLVQMYLIPHNIHPKKSSLSMISSFRGKSALFHVEVCVMSRVDTNSCTQKTRRVTLQRTATRCDTRQRAAIHCNTLTRTMHTKKHAVTHCSALQHAAMHCNTLTRVMHTRARTCTHAHLVGTTVARSLPLLASTVGLGWLRSVGSIKLYVSLAEYRLFYRALLQKRPIILSILLTKATPYVT